MKCQDAEKWILLQDSGELSRSRVNALAAHLHHCTSCQQFQHALIESHSAFSAEQEPDIKLIQDVLREARRNAPEKSIIKLRYWKPALALAASVMIGIGIFSLTLRPDQVGLELLVTETQMLEADDQIADIMYSGWSEDDFAFNFLMTYEGNGQG
jgi:predicted anti-sigma-YlaC factor YlaD